MVVWMGCLIEVFAPMQLLEKPGATAQDSGSLLPSRQDPLFCVAARSLSIPETWT
jgi:hypothetical protein